MDLRLPKQSFNVVQVLENRSDSCRVELRCLQGHGEAVIYQLGPAILVSFFEFSAKAYLLNPNRRKHILEINYGLEGQAEHILADGTFVYSGKNELIYNLESSHSSEIRFPRGYYKGVGIVIDLQKVKADEKEPLAADIDLLTEKLLSYKEDIYLSIEPAILTIDQPPMNWPETEKTTWLWLKIQELILYLKCSSFDKGRQLRVYKRKMVECVKSVRQRMIDHLECRYTIEDLAREHFISPTNLKTAFKDIYGESIGAYMKTYRMKQAAEWLINSERRIVEIATALGYHSLSRFSAAFKDTIGCTPIHYRKTGGRK